MREVATGDVISFYIGSEGTMLSRQSASRQMIYDPQSEAQLSAEEGRALKTVVESLRCYGECAAVTCCLCTGLPCAAASLLGQAVVNKAFSRLEWLAKPNGACSPRLTLPQSTLMHIRDCDELD